MNKWELKILIEDEIKAIAVSEIEKFYPSYLCNVTGHPLKLILDALSIFVEEGSIELYFEYNCEECSRTLRKIPMPLKYEETIICKYCGTENEFEPNHGKVCLYINEGYRDYIRNTFNNIPKKKELRRLLLV